MHGHNHFHRRAAPPPIAVDPTALLRRAPADADSTSSSGTSSRTCSPKDTTGICERPASATTTTTLPIVLGVLIPLTAAIVVLLFLHRRHVKKLRSEDANDKHKSLDFGLDVVPSSGKTKGRRGRRAGTEMTTTDAEKSIRRHDRGLSLDITMTSPYLLPPGLHGSADSLHSLSRTAHADDDRYRTATAFAPSENGSIRSFRGNKRPGADDSSSFTGMSSRHTPFNDEMNANLLNNAQHMSRTTPPETDRRAIVLNPSHMSPPRKPATPTPDTTSDRSGIHSPDRSLEPKSTLTPGRELRKSNDYLGALIQRGTTPEAADRSYSPPALGVTNSQDNLSNELHLTDMHVVTPPSFVLPDPDNDLPKSNSQSQPNSQAPAPEPVQVQAQALPRISLPSDDDQSDYGDDQRNSTLVLPQVNVDPPESNNPQPDRKARLSTMYGLPDDQGYQFDTRRLTVGIRPLPPEDPSDNPEQRANRIRSFYKEYFDESSKSAPHEEYYEDYGHDDYNEDMPYDSAYPDPYYGGGGGDYDMGFYPPEPRPFAQPIGRRAMTPPPRMPPNFYQQPPRQYGAASALDYAHGAPSHRTFSSTSGDPGPRAYSSISNRGQPMPRNPQLPPPGPLHILPSAHKLKDDTMILPIDFAPGPTSKDRRAGRPETPQGGLRPYIPVRPANISLASSYDDLAAMPSPHALRKSGTYTALDFAPPPRFRNAETSSDSGSVRSIRTGVSAAQAYHIRNGAYRISRLPPETVGTVEDITSNLKPTWGMER
ncbi:hypothetical protein AJ78_08783 [Emergomyces pasteurianus Ep9510]|uniref:Uncharacterized protein n=1 Tax=Emergomyces pasteurianus Ep9510 TaxID=1447872 RepID=A0A1J9Q1B1_9EURO|nr:hypothetical protein AJ78_08783 [Emergomyces pasteurianus Ep9510]